MYCMYMCILFICVCELNECIITLNVSSLHMRKYVCMYVCMYVSMYV